MKNLKLICLTLTAACGLLSAQSFSDTLKTSFTHPVMVGTVQIPAGDCTITLLNSVSGNSTLLVRAASGEQAVVLANPINDENTFDSNREAGVVLSTRGGVYRLDKIWLASKGMGFQVLDARE